MGTTVFFVKFVIGLFILLCLIWLIKKLNRKSKLLTETLKCANEKLSD